MPSDDLQPSPVVDPEDRPVASRSRVRGRRSLLARLLPVMIVVVALGGFAGLVGYYYMAEGPNGAAPLIKADLQPFKVKPDNPGGMDVPDQDKAIFDRMGRVDQSSVPPPNTERLLPPPETPVPRPTVAQNTAAAVTPPPPVPPTTPAIAPQPASPAPASTASPATSSAPNPNVGGPVLGVPQTPRSPTLAAAPPGAPAGTTAPPAAASTTPKPATTTAPAVKPAASASTQAAAVPPRPEPAPAAAGGPLLRAAIASLRTEPEAKREWERQRRLYPDALSNVSPSYASVDLGGKGVYWRIYIGPPESSAEARARCAVLKEKKVDCFVARP